MYKINFKSPIHVHFIGIGGISMSGLAEILLNEDFTISGSDNQETPLTQHLVSKGATLYYQQAACNISNDIDLVVYTAAIMDDNEELQAVRNLNIPTLTRAQFLGQLMTNYRMPIAVSGTHGKTTTTSMVSHILLEGDLDPTISVGGILQAIGGNIRVGNSETFITEACEYTNSFLNFAPMISIILNIEEDHMDYFKDIHEIRDSFHKFAQILPDKGHLIINGEIEAVDTIYTGLSCDVITYGLDGNYDYSAKNINYNEAGLTDFDLYKKGEFVSHIQLSVSGRHNVSNALSAIATGEILGVDLNTIQKGILSFKGTDRRFEYKGTFQDVTVIDDYAHHPTEIDATLEAVKHYPHNDLWVIFQPHTYTRTKAFFEDFAQSLSGVSHLILTDIFAAREKDTLGISSEMLAKRIKELGCDVTYISDFSTIQEYLKSHCKHGDLLITMGAGNVVDIGDTLIKE